MKSPLLSVIIPIYDVEHYLRYCLDSIINQSYKELEIILVNDGSPDGCEAICLEYASKDKRIKYLKKENGGLSSARNFGLEAAQGDYISFVDSDDWLDCDIYRKGMEQLALDGYDDKTVLSFRAIEIYSDKKIIRTSTSKREEYSQDEVFQEFGKPYDWYLDDDRENRYIVSERVATTVWDKIYPKSLIYDLRFTDKVFYEDTPFALSVFLRMNKLIQIPDLGYYYRKGRVNTITGNSELVKLRLIDFVEGVESIIMKIKGSNKKRLINIYRFEIIKQAFSDILSQQSQYETLKRLYTYSKKYSLYGGGFRNSILRYMYIYCPPPIVIKLRNIKTKYLKIF